MLNNQEKNTMEISAEILKALNWRYAVKKFDATKKIPESDWATLQEIMRLTPSSYGLQPWNFILVENPEIRQKLKPVSRDQSQVTDCSHYLVLTHLKKINETHVDQHLQQMATTRLTDVAQLSTFKKAVVQGLLQGRRAETLNHWAERQCYIVMGQVMAMAALMEIDTCPMEGLEPAEYDKILNLENSDYATIASIAFGYRNRDDKYAAIKKVRFSRDQVFSRV